jgi:nicotinamidase/pyrazinamidase
MFHPDLKLPPEAIVVSKGMDPESDSYSAFQATDARSRGLKDLLNSFKVHDLFVGGLATDYCVKSSVLDALKHGLSVHVLTDAVRGVNLKPGDSKRAMDEMIAAGAKKAVSSDLSGIFQLRRA